MSAPVLNTPPSPRSSTTLISSSIASSSRYAPSCSRIAGSYALRRVGLSSVRRAMPVLASRSRSTRLSLTGLVLPDSAGLRRAASLTYRCFQRAGIGPTMDFRLDEAQRELSETVRRFCEERFAPARIREREGRPIDRADWRAMAELGVFALRVPEARGGLGLGVVEAAIAFEQLGAHLVNGPALWSTLAAPFLDGVASGERLVGGVEGTASFAQRGEAERRPSASFAQRGEAERRPSDSAEPIVVEHAEEIDV